LCPPAFDWVQGRYAGINLVGRVAFPQWPAHGAAVYQQERFSDHAPLIVDYDCGL